jgi:transcriptional regulator with XRE-family HTH domain
MALKDNLKRVREEKRLSQPKLAELAGVSQQLISRLENGKDLTTKKLPEIARALGVTVAELDENFGGEADFSAVAAPLISWVSAGALEKPEIPVSGVDDMKRATTVGLDPKGQWIALRVKGDSMDRISPPDSLIFVNLKDRRLVPNACYVISDEDGGASYKRYRPSPARWEAVSTNGKHKPYLVKGDHGPRIIGRVKRTVLDL